MPVVRIKAKAVSSTYIRKLILAGRLKQAEELLLRPVSAIGTVIRGRSLSTRLGYPTANINPHHEVLPPAGVYAARMVLEGKIFPGICYIAGRSNLRKKKKAAVEAHIFGLRRDIYHKHLEVQFIRRIRKEKKFRDLSALSRQIKKDIAAVKS